MPLSTALSGLESSVPVWIVSGLILSGGYAWDKARDTEERLTAVEASIPYIVEKIDDIGEGVTRVEGYLMERPNE